MPPSTPLQSTWTTLYASALPSLARAKAPSQPTWPVHLDHCFARIILDAVVGSSPTPTNTPATPWTARLKSPAVKNMSPTQLEQCIALGEDIASGRANLLELDQRSLNVRGKKKMMMKGGGEMGKRKRAGEQEASMTDTTTAAAAASSKRTKTTAAPPPVQKPDRQPTILSAMGLPTPPSSSSSAPPPIASPIPPDLHALITTTTTLSPFRQRVLLCLCQIPRGHHSTYAALARHLDSAPRAVGSALRGNPFAPRVPCHRVVAADGGIGGFNGEWGDAGKYCQDKVGLLKEEGVRVREKRGKICVEGRVWEGFV